MNIKRWLVKKLIPDEHLVVSANSITRMVLALHRNEARYFACLTGTKHVGEWKRCYFSGRELRVGDDGDYYGISPGLEIWCMGRRR